LKRAGEKPGFTKATGVEAGVYTNRKKGTPEGVPVPASIV